MTTNPNSAILAQINQKFQQLGYTGAFDGTSPMAWAKNQLKLDIPQHLGMASAQVLQTVMKQLNDYSANKNAPTGNQINTGTAPTAGTVGGPGTQGGTAGSGYGQISPGSYVSPTQRNNSSLNPNVFGHLPSQQNPTPATQPQTASSLPQQPAATGAPMQMNAGSSQPQAPAQQPVAPSGTSQPNSFMNTNWGNNTNTDANGIYNNLQGSLSQSGYGSAITQTLVQGLQKCSVNYAKAQKPPDTMYF